VCGQLLGKETIVGTQVTSLRQDFREAIASRRMDVIIEIGLVAGAVLGILGSVVTAQNIRAEAWTVDGVGLIVATCLLALRFFRHGDDCVAAGFLVYALGEAVVSIGNAAGPVNSIPSFQAGTALWSAGLMLTATPRVLTRATRLASFVAAILFAVVSIRIAWGEQILATSRPLPYFAYPFLVLTFAGWFWHVAKRHR
jgi:hypothetical protein